MKNLEMIIRKETVRGARFYRYGKNSIRLFPVKKAEVEMLMAEGSIEIVNEERKVIWSPAVEEVVEVVEEVTMETVEAETEEMKSNFEEAEKMLGFVRKYKDMKFFGEGQVYYVRYKKAGGKRIIFHLEHPEKYKELLEDDVQKEGKEKVEKAVDIVTKWHDSESTHIEKSDLVDLYIHARNMYKEAFVEKLPERVKRTISELISEEDVVAIIQHELFKERKEDVWRIAHRKGATKKVLGIKAYENMKKWEIIKLMI